ncbi:MAG TPA: response regulator [Polyangiaceae bacterium]|nr:response regulator [Polyangiaceae bacterium]
MKGTVLIVDDSLTVRMDLAQAFEADGFAVLPCATGAEACALAAQGAVSAAILDVLLPDADGVQLLEQLRIRAQKPELPILMLSTEVELQDRLRGLRKGADDYLGKPYDTGYVVARVNELLRSRQPAPSKAPGRVLLVDDSETYLQETARLLRGAGYEVLPARSGEQALELLGAQAVDCVLLDLVMPGLSGRDTCRQIKSSPRLREVPLIMVTSVEDHATMIESLSLGADDYITKSSEFAVLEARLRAQIRRKQFEDEHRRVQQELLASERRASEAWAASQVAQAQAALAQELDRKNKELEAFNYSVSHDLRAPLRTIDGFSHALLEDFGGALEPRALDYLKRVRAATKRMGELIDDLLQLSRIGRSELRREGVDLAALARAVAEELARCHPEHPVAFSAPAELPVNADRRLLQVVLENLLGNAWKFTSRASEARVECGLEPGPQGNAYFVRDNGAGFDMAYAERLFNPFQRLHTEEQFAGTGIGLATVQRVIDRHGGRVWAHGEVGKGATVYFTLPVSAA